MAKTSSKFDIYDYVTKTIVASIETGTAPWRKCWTGSSQGLQMPTRITGDHYRGINVLMLWVVAQEKGYLSARWMTYRQAQELGGQVRKGEKSTAIIKYGTIKAKETARDEMIKDGWMSDQDRPRAYARAYSVFNVDQIDGLPEDYYVRPDPPRDLGTRADPALDAWFARIGVAVETTSEPSAHYSPGTDRIHMPPIETFFSAHDYYGVFLHETAHASGSKHRLDRQHQGNRQDRYAQEEIVADLASAMAAARLGLKTDIDQNAAYIDHWIALLKTDSRSVFRAAAMAQAAVDWMFEQAGAFETPADAAPTSLAAE